jgi:hypothetical protein
MMGMTVRGHIICIGGLIKLKQSTQQVTDLLALRGHVRLGPDGGLDDCRCDRNKEDIGHGNSERLILQDGAAW